MKQRTIQLLFILLISVTLSGCPYHKPSFTGKVIDTETKEPIEGAIAVVVYNKKAFGGPGGPISTIINVREALTNTEGIFHISSYTTLIFPFTWQTDATFIIYKPGYGNFYHQHTYPPGLDSTNQELFFSIGVGEEKMFNNVGAWPQSENKILKAGIIELPKLRTREERRQASSVGVTGFTEKELPLFYKALKEKDKALDIR